MARWSLRRLGRSGAAVFALAALAALSGLPHARASFCPARYTIMPGFVVDNDTKLLWVQSELGIGVTFAAAGGICSQIAFNGVSWRLPTVLELQTLVDETKMQPAIDTVAFPGAMATGYWTATADAGGSVGERWVVDFVDGKTRRIDPGMKMNVRCVH